MARMAKLDRPESDPQKNFLLIITETRVKGTNEDGETP